MEAPLRWQDSYEQLRAASDERQLFERIAQFAKRLGFVASHVGMKKYL